MKHTDVNRNKPRAIALDARRSVSALDGLVVLLSLIILILVTRSGVLG